MCGKLHQLPEKPELKVGMKIMVHAIDPRSPHAELNGYEVFCYFISHMFTHHVSPLHFTHYISC
jgi:hypothetical protein